MVAKRRMKSFSGGCIFLAVALVLLMFANTGVAAAEKNVQHYKMISTIEYAGAGQFRN